MKKPVVETAVKIRVGSIALDGDLASPEGAEAIVLFAHGTGSSRHSPRNRYVASVLQKAGIATLLFDLLTEAEEEEERYTRHLRFDIEMLTERLVGATDWLIRQKNFSKMKIGYFGASTGAAAALKAAVERSQIVRAVVSRGGRPDLAGEDVLPRVKVPALLIVGGNDRPVIEMNRDALALIGAKAKKLEIVPGATHLFEEPGTLEEVARIAVNWFEHYLKR